MTVAADKGGRWADLSRRVASALVLLLIGGVLALSTGIVLQLGIAIIIGLTFWELINLTGTRQADLSPAELGGFRATGLAIFAGLCLFLALRWHQPLAALVLLLPVLAGLRGTARHQRLTFTIFGVAVLMVGFALVVFREDLGLAFILWLMGIVIVSDILGYFAGRTFGGPKFWPKLSPKKTWSGTVAGWIGAAVVGAVIWLTGHGDSSLVWLSPVVALAGQLGDIAESWLKRRAGVKDSSNLIPGHGGLMDRFDAVSGATLAVMVISLIVALPAVT